MIIHLRVSLETGTVRGVDFMLTELSREFTLSLELTRLLFEEKPEISIFFVGFGAKNDFFCVDSFDF